MAKKKKRRTPERKARFDDIHPHTRQAIWAVVFGLLAAFFILSLLNTAGPVGTYTDMSLTALFGSGAWLAPFICVVYIFVLLNPKESDQEISTAKVLGTILLFLSLLGGLHLYETERGGWAGWLFAEPLTALFGGALATILVIGALLISIFLLFNTGLRLPKRTEPEDDEDLFAD